MSINEGQDADFICKFSSFPLANKITWIKNDSEELISETEKIEILNLEESSALKLIKPNTKDNGSNYLVKIKNDFGEVSSNKAILSISSGPVFILEPNNLNVLRDKEAKFETVVKANPKPNVIWLFNDKEIVNNKDGYRIEKDVAKDKYTLIINKVSSNNIGTFTCKASNEYGSIEKSCTLDVLELPKINSKLENITVNENDQAKFTVKVSGKPKPTFKWFKDDCELVINSELFETNETQDDEINLIIKSCRSQEHSGAYYVKVTNDYGEVVSNKATLTINRAPKFINVPKNTVVVQDQSVKFECLVDALPKAKISWFLNGKELTVKDNVKFEVDPKSSSNNLIIPKVSQSTHLGKYTIKASNNVGESEHSFDVDVLGKFFRVLAFSNCLFFVNYLNLLS